MTNEVRHNRSRKGVATGLIIIGIGVVLLLRKMDVFIPGWVLGWQMIMVYIGLAIGIGSKFRNPASYILMGLGFLFLINDLYYIPITLREYFWPLVIIIIGLIVLIRPRKKKHQWKNAEWKHKMHSEGEDYESSTSSSTYHHKADKLDSVSIFNGVKRRVVSKNFQGGETVSIFGGAEINLIDADFEGTIEIESVVIFGGLKLIVPPNWEVRNNVTAILGGVEDKRMSAVEVVPDDKVLVLTGAVIFGGLDIVSY